MVKILDTKAVDEIASHWEDPTKINKNVAEELADFFHFDVVIIPFFRPKERRSLVVVVENQLDPVRNRILVTLFDRAREDEEDQGEGEGEFEDISNIIHAIIQIVMGTDHENEYVDKIEGGAETLGVTEEWDMIPAILQIAEAKVMHSSRCPNEGLSQYRHKILDRLIGFHLL